MDILQKNEVKRPYNVLNMLVTVVGTIAAGVIAAWTQDIIGSGDKHWIVPALPGIFVGLAITLFNGAYLRFSVLAALLMAVVGGVAYLIGTYGVMFGVLGILPAGLVGGEANAFIVGGILGGMVTTYIIYKVYCLLANHRSAVLGLFALFLGGMGGALYALLMDKMLLAHGVLAAFIAMTVCGVHFFQTLKKV